MTPNQPDIITYFLRVVDVLERDYYVRMPKTYQLQGWASTYCANYIVGAFADDIPVADAAFVLCNKIQRREWEDDPINPPKPAAEYLTPASWSRAAAYLEKFKK